MRRTLQGCCVAETVIETPRLLLCQWDDAAWDAFIRHANTPPVLRWLGDVLDAEGVARFRARIAGYQAQFGFTFWCVCRREDGGHLSGEVIGMCGFKRADKEEGGVTGMLEVGWRLRQEAWGQGYAKEAARACLDWGFATQPDDRIIALTVIQNSASWGLMERLGMTCRPEWDHHDPRYSDELNPTIVYAIERGNFA
jgi:RimJ/RimL family protein N-acetyltransferase